MPAVLQAVCQAQARGSCCAFRVGASGGRPAFAPRVSNRGTAEHLAGELQLDTPLLGSQKGYTGAPPNHYTAAASGRDKTRCRTPVHGARAPRRRPRIDNQSRSSGRSKEQTRRRSAAHRGRRVGNRSPCAATFACQPINARTSAELGLRKNASPRASTSRCKAALMSSHCGPTPSKRSASVPSSRRSAARRESIDRNGRVLRARRRAPSR